VYRSEHCSRHFAQKNASAAGTRGQQHVGRILLFRAISATLPSSTTPFEAVGTASTINNSAKGGGNSQAGEESGQSSED